MGIRPEAGTIYAMRGAARVGRTTRRAAATSAQPGS
jgi:hypothetical protein